MKEQYGKLIKYFIWCAIILFCIRCFISWKSIVNNISVYSLFGYAGEAISLTTLISIFYERYLWRYFPFNSTPVLHPKYEGTFKSSYDNLERSATLIIKQTLLSLHVTLITSESRSNSMSASIEEILGEKTLTYCYLNTPSATVRDRSQIHYGTAVLYVENPNILTGLYFTDRKTIGDMKFNAIIN